MPASTNFNFLGTAPASPPPSKIERVRARIRKLADKQEMHNQMHIDMSEEHKRMERKMKALLRGKCEHKGGVGLGVKYLARLSSDALINLRSELIEMRRRKGLRPTGGLVREIEDVLELRDEIRGLLFGLVWEERRIKAVKKEIERLEEALVELEEAEEKEKE